MPPETVPVETPPLEITQCTPEAWPELVSVLAQAFNTTGEGWGSFRDRVGDENLRVARIGGQIVGGLGYYPMGQFFGGRSVPIGGIAGVGVAPHVRGQGVARAMVVDVLRSLRAAATPVSGLYPASLQVYRSCGFEPAGDRPLRSARCSGGCDDSRSENRDSRPVSPRARESRPQQRNLGAHFSWHLWHPSCMADWRRWLCCTLANSRR